MKRLMLTGMVVALIASACAASNDVTADQADGDDSSNIVEDGTPDVPTESLPEDPTADPSESLVVGSGEPGDTPPPGADDGESLVPGGELPEGVAFAMADLSARLDVSGDVIDWVLHEEVEWPDGSLGCPQPGMSYTQAIVNGSRIVFEVGGVEYSYHSKAGSDPFLCTQDLFETSKDGGTKDNYVIPTTTVGYDE